MLVNSVNVMLNKEIEKMKSELVNTRSDAMVVMIVNRGSPNNDPNTCAPREMDGRYGVVSSVSIKRKFRNLWEDKNNPVWKELASMSGIAEEDYKSYGILESFNRGFDCSDPLAAKNLLKELIKSGPDNALNQLVDARLFGCTFLDETGEKGEKIRMVKGGVVQIGHAKTISPIETITQDITRKVNSEDEKVNGGGMAPDGLKFINHAVFTWRVSVNPFLAANSLTTKRDIELFKATIPFIYSANESASRPAGSIIIRNIWWADHTNALGSFNAESLFDELMPRKKNDPLSPSISTDEYEFPTYKGNSINIVDLMNK